MRRAATILGRAVLGDTSGEEGPARFDLLLRDRRGRYRPASVMKRAALAALVLRLRDYLAYR